METTLGSTVVTTLGELITAVQETLPTLPSSTNDSIYGYDEEYYLSNTTTSAWTHSSSEEPQTPPGLPPITIYMILKAILCIAILVATFFGNVLIIYAYATTKKLRTYTNHFIIGLAVADLVSGGITPGLLNIPWIIGYWPFSELLCLGALYINHVFIHATFLMTMIICFDRFWALNMPLNHLKGKTTKRAHWMMSVSYILPIFIWTPLVIIFPYIGLTIRISPPRCIPSYGLHPEILLFAVLVLSWIPIIVTLILYVFVYRAVIRKGRGKKRGIGEHVTSAVSSKRVSVDRNKAAYTKKYCPNNEPITEHSPTTNPVEPTSTNDQVHSVSTTMSLGVTNQAYNEETEDDDNHSNKHRASVDKRLPSSRSSKYEGYLANIRATRTLTYILICMVTSGLPWSVSSLVSYINPSLAIHNDTALVSMKTKHLLKIISLSVCITCSGENR